MSKFFFDYEFQKFSLLWVIIGFPTMLAFTVLVTALTTEYSITTNWISDLGSTTYAPFPWLLDYDLMITAFLLFPVFLLLEKRLVSYPDSFNDSHPHPSRLRLHLGSFMLFSFLVGLVGCFGVGFFSEDRDYMGRGLLIFSSAHALFSWLAFGGIALGLSLAGILMLSSCTIFPNVLGAFCLIGPEVSFILCYTVGGFILEWVLMFAFLGAFAPVILLLFRELSRAKASQSTPNKP